MKIKVTIHLLTSFLFIGFAHAQSLFPQPQSASIAHERFVLEGAYQITGNNAANANTLLKEILPTQVSSRNLPFEVSQITTNDPKLQRSGAYRMHITPGKISLEAYDRRSVFYALQTMRQLVQKDKSGKVSLPIAEITDYPDVVYRGSVEGFYGEPWSHADRLEQLRFYGKLKLNTYIYGPKDDPYHSSPHWHDPYPADKASQIKELVTEARKNEVDFVWAIHPGKDIKWNKADSNAVLSKFEMMYALGVRSFAVFFDDISGAGTDAHKQAGQLNYIQHQFINKKKDVTPLIMCPTEYNKSWANKKEGTYLDILGEQLDPAIHIMWTGNTVVADITKDGLEWVNKRIRRPAFVWWNFPVSDYVRDHLLMGASYGLDTDAAIDMSGFVSNPMDKAEASKLAIFSVAQYTWNIKSYDPQAAWEAAIRYVMPEASKAFRIFASHNSDPGPNGHRYRRQESVHIQPAIDSFLKAFTNDRFLKSQAMQIKKEFQNMVPVAGEITANSRNKHLVEQISPWLHQFELLANAGIQAMLMAERWNEQNHAAAWQHYLQVGTWLDSMNVVDNTKNQNPYQPGVKTGSLVLTPFVKDLYRHTGQNFIKMGQKPEAAEATVNTSVSSSTLVTNIEKLRYQPLQITNQQIAIAPVMEVTNLQDGEYVGLTIDNNLRGTTFHFNLASGNLQTWGHFETSVDGHQWKTVKPADERGKGSFNNLEENTRYIRFINTSGKQQSLNLREFKIDVKPAGQGNQSIFLYDGSINTYQAFSIQEPISIELPDGLKNTPLTFLVNNKGAVYKIAATDKKGRKTILFQGSKLFITIPNAKKISIDHLQLSTTSTNPIVVYEIVKGQ